MCPVFQPDVFLLLGVCRRRNDVFLPVLGSKDEDGINRSYGDAVLYDGSSPDLAVLAMGFPQVVMGIYTDKEEIQKIGISYLRLVGLALPDAGTCHGYECTAALHRAGKSTSIWWDRSRDVQLFL